MYQVWIKDEFGETWHLTECETLADVKDAFLESLKQGQPTLVTQRLETSVEVKVTESVIPTEFPPRPREPRVHRERRKEGKDETTPGGPEDDQSPGDESHGPV